MNAKRKSILRRFLLLIRAGSKTLEIRRLGDNWDDVKAGDELVLFCSDKSLDTSCRVLARRRYKSPEAMYEPGGEYYQMIHPTASVSTQLEMLKAYLQRTQTVLVFKLKLL